MTIKIFQLNPTNLISGLFPSDDFKLNELANAIENNQDFLTKI